MAGSCSEAPAVQVAVATAAAGGIAGDRRQNGSGWFWHLSEDQFAADPSAARPSAAPLSAAPLSAAQPSDVTPAAVPVQAEAPEAAFFADMPSSDWSGPDARKLERFPVQGTRPIAMRPLGPDGAPIAPWVLADILDISLGGLCLLVSGPLVLERGQHLQLDLRSHPDFGVLRFEVEARWWMSSESFSTIGVAFPVQLRTIPELELERRGVRRDPNLDGWASE